VYNPNTWTTTGTAPHADGTAFPASTTHTASIVPAGPTSPRQAVATPVLTVASLASPPVTQPALAREGTSTMAQTVLTAPIAVQRVPANRTAQAANLTTSLLERCAITIGAQLAANSAPTATLATNATMATIRTVIQNARNVSMDARLVVASTLA
jgi:hypothetical protein